MPRNLRPFFIELSVDGRKSPVKTGPRRKDGGFDMDVFVDDKGESLCAIRIIGTTMPNGNRLLTARFDDGTVVKSEHKPK